MDFPTSLFGIAGYPLGHSLSPALHNWAFGQAAYPGVYLAWPVKENQLDAFFNAVRTLGIKGGNITIPHKTASLPFMDETSERAKKIGAINTFYWRDGNLCGENTDIAGFMAPLCGKKFSHALVLGAGGASRAVVAGLLELGVQRITLTNRAPQKALELAHEFGIETIVWEDRTRPDADLIVNATSLGMQGAQEDKTPYPEQGFAGRRGLVYDIVYNPCETRLLREARMHGFETENGIAMFVGQARAAFSLWTGREMPCGLAVKKVKELLGCQSS